MRIATILFTYHRSEHTRKVLEALSINIQKPEKLFIFQDGIGADTNVTEWRKVKEIITSITWCDVEICISNTKKGCRRTVIDGINYVLQYFDSVIVLEDDCVPQPQFISYMEQALRKYNNCSKVYSIGGHAWDIDLPSSHMDAYFNGRISSWGWGTWKNRWEQFQEDDQLLQKIKKVDGGIERLNLWGADLESMLVGNVIGTCDSWATFWALTVIKNDGVCLSPYKSLIHNIGMDGSGRHNVIRKDTWVNNNEKKYNCQFVLPDEITVSKKCESEFCSMFSEVYGAKKIQLYQQVLLNWISIKQKGGTLKGDWFSKSIAIWGKGEICYALLQELQGIAKVKYILETYPSVDEYKGIPVIGIVDLPDDIKNIIVIPFFDIEKISYKVEKYRKDIKIVGINSLI